MNCKSIRISLWFSSSFLPPVRFCEYWRYLWIFEGLALKAFKNFALIWAELRLEFWAAIRAESFHHATDLFYGESFRMWNGRGVNVLYAESLSAGCAGKMDMRGMCVSTFTSTIDLWPAAVVDFVQEFMFQKQCERSEQCGFVYGFKPELHIWESESMSDGNDFLHYHHTYCGRLHASFSQYSLYILHIQRTIVR